MDWKKAIDLGDSWVWRGEKLWHKSAPEVANIGGGTSFLQRLLVGAVYADHNRSRIVRRTLFSLMKNMPSDGLAVNVGSGRTDYTDVVNLEIADGPHIDIIGFGTELPFRDCTLDLVIAQEVLEHVPEFPDLICEIRRVLKPGGYFFCQVPFQIGFHPGPSDYWRFTRQGLEHMFDGPEWEIDQLTISVGHGSGFYRIAVEFVAVTASCLCSILYRPTKAVASIFLYPIKFFDLVTRWSPEADRIPGGYLCVVKKSKAVEGSWG